MKITQLQICLCDEKKSFQYFAEAIEDSGRYYYRVDNVILEITEIEFNRVVINPKLYYFSTALWLHLEIQRKKNNPNYVRNYKY